MAPSAKHEYSLQDTSHPTPRYQAPQKPRGQGYQVAQTASYLPQPDVYRSPSPPSSPERFERALPLIPSLDSYYQFHNQRNSWTTVRPEADASLERPQRLSAYRRDRMNDNMANNAYTQGGFYSSPPRTGAPPPPPHQQTSYSQERPIAMARMPSPARNNAPSLVSPIPSHHVMPANLPPVQTRDLGQMGNTPYIYEQRYGSPTRSDRSFVSSSSKPLGTHHASSYSSSTALAGAGAPARRTTDLSGRTLSPSPYQLQYDNAPYSGQASSSRAESRMDLGAIDPMELADDDDDDYTPRGSNQRMTTAAAGGAAAGFKALANRDTNSHYGQVYGGGGTDSMEKSAWLSKQTSGKKRLRWWAAGFLALLILGIVGAVLGVIFTRRSTPSTSSGSVETGTLTKSSPEIVALLNNKNLHKVFPGIDYTPANAQYPNCLTTPTSQQEITKDIAVLSQLTNKIRLYGTDCQQTEKIISAISALELNHTMTVYMGIWLDTNQTTNSRQLEQAYDVLQAYPSSHFSGVIVGNEVLFRKDMTETQLISTITSVKSNLTAQGITLPIGTSDLGSAWTATMASAVDLVLANVHPFFGGVVVDQAAAWTSTFWRNNDVSTTAGMTGKTNIIGEVGWPSSGGNDCGAGVTCPDSASGAVAGITQMNKFLSDWVCQQLSNGTEYFWFEAFDEPWKNIYNTATEKWETAWGIMDSSRNLKTGIVIPNCGGKTVS